jgi:hypothetical protein
MKLKSIGIANFKAFGKEFQTIPIKPITLVFGPNSAGKSSIFHALLWLQHGITHDELDVHTTQRTRTDLGGFDQVVHGHQHGTKPAFGWSIPGECIKNGIGGWNKFAGFDLELAFQRLSGRVEMTGFSVCSPEGPLLSANLSNNHPWRIDLLNWEHPAMVQLLAGCGSTGQGDLKALGAAVVGGLYDIEIQEFVPAALTLSTSSGGWLADTAIPEAFRLLFDAFRREFLTQLRGMIYIPPLRDLPPRGFDPFRSDKIWRSLAGQGAVLERLNAWIGRKDRLDTTYRIDITQYVRQDAIDRRLPTIIRETIIRWLGQEEVSDMEWLMEKARERWMSADRVSYLHKCPAFRRELIQNEMGAQEDSRDNEEWLSKSIEEQEEEAAQIVEDICASGPFYFRRSTHEPHFIKFLMEDQQILDFLSSHLDIGLGDTAILNGENPSELERRTELLLRDLRTGSVVSLQDVGVGISQFLPVLINSFASTNQLIAIEQPEIHIHPRLQAELGDVFIESALGENKNTFLLETHSEHLILRILRRIRETTEGEMDDWPEVLRKACPNGIRPEDVAVLYVEPGEDGAKVIELPVTPDGDFAKPWPGGFFAERDDELF